MNKRFLNKNIDSSLLKQSLPENLLRKSRSRKQARQTKKSATNYNSSGSERIRLAFPRAGTTGALRSSKLDKMKQAETQIVREFSQKELKKISLQKKESQLHSIPKQLAEESVSLLLSIEHIRSMLVSKRIEKQTPSELRDQLLESRKIRFLYGGLSKKELEKSTEKARRFLGSTADNLLIVLESRLDVALERCGFFSSIRLARQSIIHKRVRVNEKIVDTPGYWLQPGDVIQVQLLKECFANIEESKYDLHSPVDLTLAQVAQSSEQLIPSRAEGSVKFSFPTLTNPIKGVQTSGSALPSGRRVCHKQFLTLDSLLQLECLFSSMCLQAKRFSHAQVQKVNTRLVLRCLRKPCPCTACVAKLQIKHSTNKKTLLRLDTLIKASELYLAIQNKAHFSNLFVKEFITKPSLKRNNSLNANYCSKLFASIFTAVTPHLALHIQQLLQREETVYTSVQKRNMLISRDVNQQDSTASTKRVLNSVTISKPKIDYPLSLKDKEQGSVSFSKGNDTKDKESNNHKIALFSYFNDTFYHVYLYWLQLSKALLLQNQKEQLFRQDLSSAENQIVPSRSRRTKPLHLEVSYQSCNAIFLYPPQRVHLPALINVDLLVKVL